MRLEQMTVHLRARSAWEAVELGTALVRRHAAAIWKPWILVTLPLFVAFNAAAWALDAIWLAWLLMWWLKPAFDRIPLFVISRATFGATPSLGETLQAQLRWGWKPLLHYLTWRRFGFARSLYLPIDLLEGVQGTRLAERRRVLGGAVYGHAVLLSLVCLNFELCLVLGCLGTVFVFVDVENWWEALRLVWSLLVEDPKWWAQICANALAWIATSLIEPFFVGAGFGLYLNRRTQIEAWDVEIAFRKLRTRLTAAATPLVLALFLFGTGLPMLRAQERAPVPEPAPALSCPITIPDESTTADGPPTLPIVFGNSRVDERGFSKAVDQAYRDPKLNAGYTKVTWEPKDKTPPKPPKQQDLSWLSGFTALFAFIAEWGLWILVGGLVVILLLTLRHWLPWMRGSLRRYKPLPTEVETEVLQLPEILPDDVPAAARRLWREGRPRHALALLYRASVETMATRAEVALVPGATESECLRASKRMPDGEDRSLFARMVRIWQYAAYGQRLPTAEEFEALLGQLQARFRWTA